MGARLRQRIAIVVRPAVGGIRRHVTLLCSRLVANYDVILFAPADFTLDRPVPEVTHIPLAISAKTRPLHDWRTIYKLKRLLREHHCDWVHAHGLRAALIGVMAASRVGIPAFFTAHNLAVRLSWLQRTVFPALRGIPHEIAGVWFKAYPLLPHSSFLQKRILKSLGKKANAVIAVSNAVKQTLSDCEIAPSKITVIPNGIDLAEIDTQTSSECLPIEGKVVAGIGRLSPEKGFDLLLQAFDLISSGMPEAHLVIAGTGAEEQNLKALAATLPHPERVHFLGYVEDTAMVYRSADVIAIPSREEGQGIVAIEAMAYRKPVVAFDVGGLRETLIAIDAHAGIVVKPEHVESLAESMLQLLRNEAMSERLGKAGRKRVEQEYTVEKMVERIIAVYKENT